jgi:membrane protein implicated in regulation of membrane protease activity
VYGNNALPLGVPTFLHQNNSETYRRQPMTEATIWWLLAGGAVVAELLTGTFFLLMIGTAMAAGALAAHAGADVVVQLLVAAVVGGGNVVAWYFVKKHRKATRVKSRNTASNLDIGETVMVDGWKPDGTASVRYRGSNWSVIRRSGEPADIGAHRVVEVIGTRLLVEKLP